MLIEIESQRGSFRILGVEALNSQLQLPPRLEEQKHQPVLDLSLSVRITRFRITLPPSSIVKVAAAMN